MALSRCPACENRYFEMKTAAPKGANFDVAYVQCAKCGSVVGVLEGTNAGAVLESISMRIDKIAKAVNAR